MRLIDADVYCATICRCNRRACDRAKCPIHNAPTAYDIDKVVEELEELRDRYDDGIKNFAIRGIIEKAIEIVKQEAEQYNNGFNDIVEIGLPPVGKPLIVTVKDNLQGRPNELRYPVYYEKDSMKGGYHWSWRYGDFAYELVPDVSEVIAWQPLPQPYQPNGE